MGYESTVILAPLPTPAVSPPGAPAQPPTPGTSPSCLNTSDLCKFVFDHTGNAWLASSSYYLLIKPLQIVLIIVIAIALRFVLHRAITQLVRRTSDAPGARRGGLLRLQDAVFTERRRQRAEAIGSVLSSFATAAIFSIAALMVLAQLGIELAPLLASAGIAGLALGFGAQTLVKDLIAGLFMLLEDQYGVGDVVDLGEASGTVESVGLRTTSIRDARGVLWHIRNGEIVRVGNKSQGWALVVIDMPIGFASVEEATQVMQDAVDAMADDEHWRDDLMDAPQILGVEHLTVDGATIRATVKTTTEAQPRVTRELRLRLTDALAIAGITGAISANRVYVPRTAEPPDGPTVSGG
jgi:small conductance mechanosensitive channel